MTYEGNFVAITRSTGRPCTSSRSRRRQTSDCVMTALGGYHLNGTATSSVSCPARTELRDEVLDQELGAAARERDLRMADEDPQRCATSA